MFCAVTMPVSVWFVFLETPEIGLGVRILRYLYTSIDSCDQHARTKRFRALQVQQ